MKIYVNGFGKTGRYCYFIEERAPRFFEEKRLTNNQAEHKAIISALQDNKVTNIEILSDYE
jgi:ribonuclease HI